MFIKKQLFKLKIKIILIINKIIKNPLKIINNKYDNKNQFFSSY